MIRYFFWLTSQVFDGLLYGWPMTLILLLLIVIAGGYSLLFKGSRFRKTHLIVVAPLLLSLLVLVWGTIMALYGSTRGPAWSSNVLGVLSLLQIPVALGVIYLTRGLRWFAASVLLFELWVAFFCNLIAAMSVSNVWM